MPAAKAAVSGRTETYTSAINPIRLRPLSLRPLAASYLPGPSVGAAGGPLLLMRLPFRGMDWLAWGCTLHGAVFVDPASPWAAVYPVEFRCRPFVVSGLRFRDAVHLQQRPEER